MLEKKINFRHTTAPDDVEKGLYTSSIYQGNENSIMNLGHGRAGHLPDYGYARYRYMPAWGEYREIIKDNPSDYKHAFWIRGAAINEKDACRYSDCVIALNRKDALRMAELYSREADAVIPITMKDNYHDISQEQLIPCSKGGTKEVFFLGSYFPGNVKGLKWFC